MTQHTDSLILTWLAVKRREDATRWWPAESVARGIGVQPAQAAAALTALTAQGRVLYMIGHRGYWKGIEDGDR